MHWVKVIRPQYQQSQQYQDQIGEVVGRWGPENTADAREGYLVEFADGEIVGVAEDEVQEAEQPIESEGPGS